ncbi:metallophosphoesterase [Mucilaginibacter ginsenosidivorans]|uniref:Metallophosphoesterase n=1 Tax=Mucilaginibacter ginsenosidivorans TaxID=398053 RepID=A0A5B8V3X3_9SPHI|nr:metallophosphoesterase [Mucilaginibacter ginsenosidivorans]QEC65513.1 metallophosphoesterase [Mucilaginibacter ginsenosidivorans]
MESQSLTVFLICVGVIAIDFYLFPGMRLGLKKWKFTQKKAFAWIYWTLSIIITSGVFIGIFVKMSLGIRAAFLLAFFLLFISKAMFLPFILADDIRRIILKFKRRKSKQTVSETPQPNAIPRSEFLMKAGLLAGSVPLAGMVYGTISGVYDYRVHYQKLYLPNLPKAFDGIKLGQISDIHSGSFYNKKAVAGGVEMLMREKADFIFFTGDLVNKRSKEMYEYQDIFSKVKAPLGVYSSLGNHDYGDYWDWPDEAAKMADFNKLVATHKNMGWYLLRNENRRLKVNGEEIGILGVENWGSIARFPRRGRMEPTIKNTDDLPVKLLLSHDPSHWRAQILPEYKQIDAMFSGHTHGMQFGVRGENFQWSPIEYIYPEWAGLYREDDQQLYVNVGYGFLGYPGRLGILPEITIFELKASADPSLQKKA